MWGIPFADLRYRYRQFLIAVIRAGQVLAMALLLPGSAFATVRAIAVGVMVVASFAAMRRATGADPAAAFAG